MKREKRSPPTRGTISPSRCLSHATSPSAQWPITQARPPPQTSAIVPRWQRPATRLQPRSTTPQAGQNPATPTEPLRNSYRRSFGVTLYTRVHRDTPKYTRGTPDTGRVNTGSSPYLPARIPPGSKSSSASGNWLVRSMSLGCELTPWPGRLARLPGHPLGRLKTQECIGGVSEVYRRCIGDVSDQHAVNPGSTPDHPHTLPLSSRLVHALGLPRIGGQCNEGTLDLLMELGKPLSAVKPARVMPGTGSPISANPSPESRRPRSRSRSRSCWVVRGRERERGGGSGDFRMQVSAYGRGLLSNG